MVQANNQRYLAAVDRVLQETKTPYRFVSRPIVGPQCVTVTIQVSDKHLDRVTGLGERFAYWSGSQLARCYRDLSLLRVEFTLPMTQWQDVYLSALPHRAGIATIGQQALGPVARIGWNTPHKAIFGSTQSGKTTCLSDFIISLARSSNPANLAFLIINPKNDRALHPFSRLAHLAAPIATTYEESSVLLRYALGEMERRRADQSRCRQRWVVIVDEVAQLAQVNEEVGPLITSLSQMAGGLGINLIVTSQAANPSVFGDRGSLAMANFVSRLVFQLPKMQSALATGLAGQDTQSLGGKGDGLAIVGDRVTRFRAALPEAKDYDRLPFATTTPALPPGDQLAGDVALTAQKWQVPPEMLVEALCVRDSASHLQKKFGGAMDTARLVRDYAIEYRQAKLALRGKETA